MSRIFITGMSPMPFENDRKVYGTGIRTWHFLLPLLKMGHKICVCNYAIPSAYPEDFKSKYIKNFIYRIDSKGEKDFLVSASKLNKEDEESKSDYYGSAAKAEMSDQSDYEFEYNILKKDDFENIELISGIFNRFKPDCIIGCTFYPSHIASKLPGLQSDKDIAAVPFWADLFGHAMAEAQARAYVDGDDSCLFHYWNSEYNIITSADIFSCVSSRQKYALIGELGAAGRLNRYTARYDFGVVIPCGISEGEYVHTKNIIRGKNGIKDNDFVVLWTGGYNTWTDVDTLFKGLISVMEKNPEIKFVSTGGEIPEQDLKTYPYFLSLIDSSPYKDRFIMKGWVPGEDVPGYYLEADTGINIDKDIYEVKLGSKNRILDWFKAGLCVLSSNVCELTDIIEKEKIGYTFKPGDYNDLGEKLIYLADHRDEAARTAKAGKEYALRNFNFDITTSMLQIWAEKPYFSPDHGKERKLFLSREEALNNLEQIALRQRKMIEERNARIQELEAIVEKGFVYKIYTYFKVLKRKISS